MRWLLGGLEQAQRSFSLRAKLDTAGRRAFRGYNDTGRRERLAEEGLVFYSTVTDLARLRGLSTSVPRANAVW